MKKSNILFMFLMAMVSSLFLFTVADFGVLPSVGLPLASAAVAQYMGLEVKVSSVLYNLVFCTLIAGALILFMGSPGVLIAGILYCISLLPISTSQYNTNMLRSEVVKTIYGKKLQTILYPDNEFYKDSEKDEDVALDATLVEIPQEGSAPQVYKNPEVRPLPLNVPKDLKKSYSVDLYETKPDLITDLNADMVSYPKMEKKTLTHANTLNNRIAEEIAIAWFPTLGTRIARTSGASGGVTKTGMTGNRKKLTYADFLTLEYIVKRYIKDDGRFKLLIDAEFKQEILGIAEFRDFDKTGIVGTLATGAVGKILNMNVYFREGTPFASNASTPIVDPYGAAVDGTDNCTILAWHPDFVRHAEGRSQLYLDPFAQPGMGGRRMNAAVRGGGTPNRLDELGVAALVQANV